MGNEQTKPAYSNTQKSNQTPNVKSIKIMDRDIRRKVRKGVSYNMKIIIRGAKGTGKTSLYYRLQGQPIPETHESTNEIQIANISWNFKSEEYVKIEIWDIVDESCSLDDLNEDARAGHTVPGLRGKHRIGAADATSVDVYSGTHCVIFVTDVTKWETFEYVKRELPNVPKSIPTVVLGNFRDLVEQRKVSKEDIHKSFFDPFILKQRKFPIELHYFECSFKNCYGLKVLHQYLNMPFIQLKLATLRQQVMLLEAESAKAKSDVHVAIAEQRYHDYINFLQTSRSDIRTGRARTASDLVRQTQEIDYQLENDSQESAESLQSKTSVLLKQESNGDEQDNLPEENKEIVKLMNSHKKMSVELSSSDVRSMEMHQSSSLEAASMDDSTTTEESIFAEEDPNKPIEKTAIEDESQICSNDESKEAVDVSDDENSNNSIISETAVNPLKLKPKVHNENIKESILKKSINRIDKNISQLETFKEVKIIEPEKQLETKMNISVAAKGKVTEEIQNQDLKEYEIGKRFEERQKHLEHLEDFEVSGDVQVLENFYDSSDESD